MPIRRRRPVPPRTYVQESAPESTGTEAQSTCADRCRGTRRCHHRLKHLGITAFRFPGPTAGGLNGLLSDTPLTRCTCCRLVEVLGGKKTSEGCIDRGHGVLRRDRYAPVEGAPQRSRAFSPTALQEALWREILHLVNDDVASTEELDAAITYGPGPPLAFMGTCLAFHMAGGDAGMHDFMKQFGPALKLPWTKLEALELTPELIEKMAVGPGNKPPGPDSKKSWSGYGMIA